MEAGIAARSHMMDAGFGLAAWKGDYVLGAQRLDSLANAQAGGKYWQAKVDQDLAFWPERRGRSLKRSAVFVPAPRITRTVAPSTSFG